ncbi:helix-turn-helix transcriptional regulator [Cryptosporangium phraense]|uniref:helix-turn-helix transcriptional regulator n=1 Tax=Cryptosporangium phraense TaxID=2593070 RepID=UPI00197B01FC|nr:helix-turn-helix transcriptional regulator [Cryptosporangium phraense]
MTAAARAQIDDLGSWDNGSLPANVLAVVALARSGGRPAETRVLARTGRWLALRAMALSGHGDGHGHGAGRSVVVTIDPAAQAAIGQMALAARGLTAREQDVAQLVLRGASTQAIASALFLSPHTVQDHLKAIFDKLGVRSRREMIAQLVLA